MLRLRWREAMATVLVLLLLSACGGGGGDEDEGGTPSGGTPPAGPFSVGGSVTGLTGNLVLRLNGTSDAAINGAGAFTFTQRLDAGTAYTVTIIQQPANQVCGPVVTNGTGTISGANVTNVQVACASYSVGGKVSGLTGSGLVLQINGANDLSVPASSTSFAFPSSIPLIYGLLYTVHIKVQPAGQTCTIVDSSGVATAAAPNVTAPTVDCVANVTDGLSGTFKVVGEPARAFVTFYQDGTFILGRHGDDPVSECGSTKGNGIQYGVYRWNKATRAFSVVRVALNTIGSCSFGEGAQSDLIIKPNGDLIFITDGEESPLFSPVASTPGTLIGTWGDNQAFIAFESTGNFMLAMTRSITQNVNASPGIEDGCYDMSGTTASGRFTLSLGSSCKVTDTLTAIDTSGAVGLSNQTSSTIDFSVPNDALQLLVGQVNPLPFVPGLRIARGAYTPTTFTVSGTINGLTSAGLALRLASQVDLAATVHPAPNATTFTLPTALTSDSPYQVITSALPETPSTQGCFIPNGTGTITTHNVTNITVNCFNAAPFTAGGQVTGLIGTGLSLRMEYRHLTSGVGESATLAIGANGAYTFPPGTIPANNLFTIGIASHPTGQTCTITRAKALVAVNNIAIACVNNPQSQLTGTYSALDAQGRAYLNFNSNGTYTSAFIHNSADCNEGSQIRNGNGVEYGVFRWDAATGAFQSPVAAAVDTNDTCGLWSNGDSFAGTITRVGNTIEIREATGGSPIAVGTAVDSVPGSLVGAFVPQANNGQLLVFHSDGTFLWAEVQGNGLFPYGYGQERGCYSISESTVTLTIASSCQPDGRPAYDLNGGGGLIPAGFTTIGPAPFNLVDANTLSLFGTTFVRTRTN